MKSFVAALFLLTSVPTLLSVILTWKTKDANIFKIPWTAISMSKRYHVLPKENYNKSYAQQFTLDERCARGLPVSIAWHKYDPYTGINPLPHPKTRKNYGLGITGIIPAILNDMIQYCCPAGSEVQYGMFLANVREAENQRVSGCYDFTFPLGARHAHQTTFGDRVFVPLVRAPRVVLLAHDNHKRSTKTHKLVTTIMDAWPMFIFILVSASLSGFMIWFLDHYNNTSEFSSSAVRGPWEGFWFSLVTMTTVGYGDRNPKSVLARIFCTMWIIMGLVVTSSFIAMITTSLSARTVMHFPIHGSLIGAVNGSEEYRLGVSKNAEMRVFKNVYIMSQALIKHEIDGALVDNFVITKVREQLKDQPVRIEKFIEHPVTYGVALGQNSSKIARCLRHFKTSYARKVWEAIRINLQPVMVKDTANEGLKVVEGMFYEENSFKLIVFGGLAILGCLLLLGILYEIYMRRTLITRVKKTEQLKQDKKSLQLKEIQKKCNHSTHSCSSEAELLATYFQFHKEWISKFPSPRERQALFYSEYSSATPLGT